MEFVILCVGGCFDEGVGVCGCVEEGGRGGKKPLSETWQANLIMSNKVCGDGIERRVDRKGVGRVGGEGGWVGRGGLGCAGAGF